MNRHLMRLALALASGLPAALPGQTPPALVTWPVPLIGITPCRIVDTRDANRGPDYGPPSLDPGDPRDFTLVGQCGIPAGAQAVSLNITVVNTDGPGYVLLYPQGGAQPVVSTLNYVAGQTVANAATVPLGTNGGITVAAAVSATDLIIDTNGYYGAAAVDVTNTFLGLLAGNATMSGLYNTGMGYGALGNNTTGLYNTAIGTNALQINDTGSSNTGIGVFALGANVSGFHNTAFGAGALAASGTGSFNTAGGTEALAANATGSHNTAVGTYALYNATGSGNTAVGYYAGFNLLDGDNNLYVGNVGGASESNTIRIGDTVHTRVFLQRVRGVTTGAGDAIPVVIDSAGQLGTVSSSRRHKEDIREIGDASARLKELRPVTFRYRNQPQGPTQFGLIAEEVAQVLPELVVRDAAGDPETVLYHAMPAMLVNELQRQQRILTEQEATSLAQQEEIARQDEEALAEQAKLDELLAEVAALEARKPAAPSP